MNISGNANYIELENFYDDKTAMVVASVLVDDEIIISKYKSRFLFDKNDNPFILTNKRILYIYGFDPIPMASTLPYKNIIKFALYTYNGTLGINIDLLQNNDIKFFFNSTQDTLEVYKTISSYIL